MKIPKVVADIQARIGSTRLPGKVLLNLADKPVLKHVVERAAAIKGVDEVVIAIPKASSERPLKELAASIPEAFLYEGRDRKSTRLNSSHLKLSRMPSSA